MREVERGQAVRAQRLERNATEVLEYGIGPTASYLNDDTGEPYFGLYQVTVYPLGGAGGKRVFPMVYHNGTYVRCYFDSGGLEPVLC